MTPNGLRNLASALMRLNGRSKRDLILHRLEEAADALEDAANMIEARQMRIDKLQSDKRELELML